MKTWQRLTAVAVLASTVFGCDLPHTSAKNSTPEPMMVISNPAAQCVWQRMASSFEMNSYYKNPRVQRHIKLYTRDDSYHLIKFSKQASPYLYHVVQMLDEHNLPHELALLPIVESEYKPQATSRVGAAGLWQLASATGRMYGLKNDRWYDERRDIDKATRAALGHLQILHKKFDGDWLLALAAYNAGGTRVANAIRANKRAGKPTDYWSLNLPTETQHFVPKFLALAHIIQNSHNLGINLEHIPNKPYYTQIDVPHQIDLHHAAALAGLDIKEVKLLNTSLRANVTHPNGPHKLILPITHVSQFKKNYEQAPKKKANANLHTVATGDTLNRIAARYSTTVRSLKSKNQLKSDIIRSGQKLAI